MTIDERALDSRLASLKYATLFSKTLELMNGHKLIINGAWFIYVVIAVVVSSFFNLLVNNENLSTFLSLPVILPLNVGVLLLAIDIARDKEVQIHSIFNYYVVVWPLFFAYILTNILIALGIVFFVLPGIYIAIALMFTQPLIADKNVSFIEAMKLSFRVVGKRWFFFFGYSLILFSVIVVILALFFGIYYLITPLGFEGINILLFSFFAMFGAGLVLYIWLLPFYTISYALLYEYLFDTLQDETAYDDTERQL